LIWFLLKLDKRDSIKEIEIKTPEEISVYIEFVEIKEKNHKKRKKHKKLYNNSYISNNKNKV